MMATAREREEFLARLVKAYPEKGIMCTMVFGRVLMRLAHTHGNLAEAECNGPGDYVNRIPYPAAGKIYERWEQELAKKQESLDRRIRELCEDFGAKIHLGGDPRGYTVKLKLPDGAHNTWGGSEEGYGVPQ